MNKVAIALLILFLTGCNLTGRVVEQDTVKIGGMFGLSGGGESWGTDELAAAQLAIEEANSQGGINGKKIELIVEDSQADALPAINAAQKLITYDGVQAIIGPTWDVPLAAVIPIAKHAGVALISPSASGAAFKDEPGYAFTTWYPDAAFTAALQAYAAKHNRTRFAIVYERSLWTEYMRDVFKEQAAQYGIDVFIDMGVVDTADYHTVIAKLKQEDLDGVYVALSTDEAILPFIKQAGEMQLGVAIYSASQNHDSRFAHAFTQYKPGVYQPYPVSTAQIAAFNARFTERFDREPMSPSTANAYDATNLVIAAMRDGAQTGLQIQTWLKNVKDFPGTSSGRITFMPDGTVRGVSGSAVVQTAAQGEFITA